MLYTLQFAFHSTNFAYWLHHIFYFSMNGTAYSTLQLAPTQSALLNTLYLMLYTLHFAFHWIALHLHLLNTHQYNGRNAVKDESVQRAPQDSVSSFATICIPTKMKWRATTTTTATELQHISYSIWTQQHLFRGQSWQTIKYTGLPICLKLWCQDGTF